MHAMDVMTTGVVTVSPDMSVQELAKLLSERGISGVPVVENDRVVGIVSEGDLLHRAETGTERRTARRRWRWFDSTPEEEARDYVKSHGRKVSEIMTRQVITVSDDTDLAEVAALMESKRVKRVPVTHDGKLVGIISRANLVRALAAAGTAAGGVTSDDRTIRAGILAELNGREWARVWPEDIVVQGGVVHLWLSDDRSEAEREALRVAAENVAGVQRIEEHLVPVPAVTGF